MISRNKKMYHSNEEKMVKYLNVTLLNFEGTTFVIVIWRNAKTLTHHGVTNYTKNDECIKTGQYLTSKQFKLVRYVWLN